MNAIIVEDEILAAERLAELIAAAAPGITITRRFDTVADTIAFFRDGGTCDLMFLDIQLADGKSFEIFTQVNIRVPVIFTTAYDQYALEAFKTNSIDYLLKPFQEKDLNRALDKLHNLKGDAGGGLGEKELNVLRDLLGKKGSGYKERILVKSGNKLQYKPVNTIAYFFADGKSAFLVGRGDGIRMLIDHTLEELEEILDPKIFFRISRKYIVQIDAIAELKGLISSRLEVRLNQQCEHELQVSRDRAADLKAWLDR
ncbi:MAG: LytR/AlgR family response regulator transcription factor [Bacteroidota bacterium]